MDTRGNDEQHDERQVLAVVRVLRFPIDVWRQYRQHNDELMREFALLAAVDRTPPAAFADEQHSTHTVPRRLLNLVDQIREAFGDFAASQTQAIEQAAARGEHSIDLTYQVAPAIADAALALSALLDEADIFCRSGQHLLTLAAPVDVAAMRRWYFGEFARQTAGEAPLPWPDFLLAHPLPSAGPS